MIGPRLMIAIRPHSASSSSIFVHRSACRHRRALVVLAKKKRPARPKVIPIEPLGKQESVTLTIRASRCQTWQHVSMLFRLYAETPDLPPLPPVNIAALYSSLWRVLLNLPRHVPRANNKRERVTRGRKSRQTLIQRLGDGSVERQGLEELLSKLAVAAGRSLPSASFTELVAVARAASSIGSLSSWLWDSIEERSLELFSSGEWRRVPRKDRIEDQDWNVKTERSLVDIALLAQAFSLRMSLNAQSDASREASDDNRLRQMKSKFGRYLPSALLLPLSSSPPDQYSEVGWNGPSHQWILTALSASHECMLSVRQEQKHSRRERSPAREPKAPSPSSYSYCRPLASLPHSFYVILSLSDPSVRESIEAEMGSWADLWLLTSRPLLPLMSDIDLHRCAIAMRWLLHPLSTERNVFASWLEAYKGAAMVHLPMMGASQTRSLHLLLSAVETDLSNEWRSALEEKRKHLLRLTTTKKGSSAG
jgi:hypothetical protein